MIILEPGFVEPSKIYELRKRQGKITLRLKLSVSGATIGDLSENQLDRTQTVLVDLHYPQVIDELRKRGFRVIGERL